MIRSPQATGVPTCVIIVPLRGLPYLKKGPEGILIQGPLRARYASDARRPWNNRPVFSSLMNEVCLNTNSRRVHIRRETGILYRPSNVIEVDKFGGWCFDLSRLHVERVHRVTYFSRKHFD
ncbi:hypothetical protein TNCV_2542781 [Trichonephila clavipes]|nr:hypothetical protein TNCV_2542781 [Trichonephila clavipes]